ncbi:hypothetical protein MBAV_002055 [Candidatus Magnetobacterium bavaricum]|uniref:Uncharacterized protein n=1 Tax=Candidatus Magnetobacterium bavaricum TaxID=29290 RepID=A0A0F3GYG9_9BACT|nr:hypothetical protein MBAV_002055 [Candidatus Magnetobacterium bavaricum]
MTYGVSTARRVGSTASTAELRRPRTSAGKVGTSSKNGKRKTRRAQSPWLKVAPAPGTKKSP